MYIAWQTNWKRVALLHTGAFHGGIQSFYEDTWGTLEWPTFMQLSKSLVEGYYEDKILPFIHSFFQVVQASPKLDAMITQQLIIVTFVWDIENIKSFLVDGSAFNIPVIVVSQVLFW